MAEATFYVTVEPEFLRRYDSNSNPRIRSIKATKITQNRPGRTPGVVVKLTVKIPDAAFLPLAPEAVIEVGQQEYDVIVHVEEPDSTDQN